MVGIDESAGMLAAASADIASDLRISRLEDPLPEGNFDLVVSAVAMHHLDGAGKADLFARAADRLRPGGRFVLGDVVVPDDPADVITPVDGVYDQPSTVPGPRAIQTGQVDKCSSEIRAGESSGGQDHPRAHGHGLSLPSS